MEEIWQWFVWFVLHRNTRYTVSWIVALGTAVTVLWGAWGVFDKAHRDDPAFPVDPHVRSALFKVGIINDMDLRDGNDGHCTIDFGGQWLMGAMLVQGHGRELYDRRVQRKVLEAAYPRADEWDAVSFPDMEVKHDADEFMGWFMGSDRQAESRNTYASMAGPLAANDPFSAAVLVSAAKPRWTKEYCHRAATPYVGGPLYPPVNAFFYAPLGLLDPHDGYRVNQFMCLVYAFIGGLGVSYLTQGRWWCPLAATLIMIYPGFKGAILLGQNPPLTLLILLWGWALVARGHPVLGGIVWGFLAFKPVWGLAFVLVPFITGRWRVCLAMGLTGLGLALATLPFVGLQSWFEWLEVGKEAAALYNVDSNWVFLSRDLLSIPRRFLLDFQISADKRDRPEAFYWGVALLAFFVGTTIVMALVRFKEAHKAVSGPVVGFLMLGAWMSCFHFMYYDILLTALPMFLLLAEPRKLVEPLFLAILRVPREHLGDELAGYYRPRLPDEHPPMVPLLKAGYRNLWVLNRMVPNVLLLLMFVEHLQQKVPIDVTVAGWAFGQRLEGQSVTTRQEGDHVLIIHESAYKPATMRLTTTLYHGGQPWDTYICIGLWMWCGILWLRMPAKSLAAPWPGSLDADVKLVPSSDKAAQPIELQTDVFSGHEGLADKDRPGPSSLQP